MGCSVADLPAYNLITPMIDSFNGDAKKFYTNFYKVFADAEDPFRGLDLSCTRLLGFLLIRQKYSIVSVKSIPTD